MFFFSKGGTCQPEHLDGSSEWYMFQILSVGVLVHWYEHEIYWLACTQLSPVHAICNTSKHSMLAQACARS